MSGGLIDLSHERRDRMMHLIQEAVGVRCHMEFFVWLQVGVGEFLPHDVMLAIWGDFQSGVLHFDVSSKIPHRQHLGELASPAFVAFIQGMHAHWLEMNREPQILTRLDCLNRFGPLPAMKPYKLSEAQSCLLHGIHDKRSQQDCLYLMVSFASPQVESMKPLCSLLIPHIDATLRRIEVLPSEPASQSAGSPKEAVHRLSEREQEVMHWVMVGKTNEEIGQILGISVNTTKNHMRHVFKKLNVSNRAQAVARLKEKS